MSTPSTRTDRALVTRRRMVRAAYDLFCERGYLGTTISEVARLAGVAVPTIYYTFGTKAVLLEESLGAAILGFDRWREPPADPDIAELLPWHHWWAEFDEATTTSGEAFDVFCHARRSAFSSAWRRSLPRCTVPPATPRPPR